MTAPIPGYPAYTITRAGVITNGNGQPIKAKDGKWVILTNRYGNRVSNRIDALVALAFAPPRPEPMTDTERGDAQRDAILATGHDSTIGLMAGDLERGVKRLRRQTKFSEQSDAIEVLGAIGMHMVDPHHKRWTEIQEAR